jgi:hypothetical protein
LKGRGGEGKQLRRPGTSKGTRKDEKEQGGREK